MLLKSLFSRGGRRSQDKSTQPCREDGPGIPVLCLLAKQPDLKVWRRIFILQDHYEIIDLNDLIE